MDKPSPCLPDPIWGLFKPVGSSKSVTDPVNITSIDQVRDIGRHIDHVSNAHLQNPAASYCEVETSNPPSQSPRSADSNTYMSSVTPMCADSNTYMSSATPMPTRFADVTSCSPPGHDPPVVKNNKCREDTICALQKKLGVPQQQGEVKRMRYHPY